MLSIAKKGMLLIMLLLLAAGCSIFKKNKKHSNDTLSMEIKEDVNVINYAGLKPQQVPTFASRGSKGRGIPVALAGSAVSLATDAVKKVIADEQKKYVAEYSFALTDLYFYDQLSAESAFDPVGMQFNGFRLIRLVEKGGQKDTALVAEFELDTANRYEIINNSIFRLKLKRIEVHETKAKPAPGSQKKVNMDFEITVKSSYVNEAGQLFDNVELGKFYFFLRGAPVGKDEAEDAQYYDKLKGRMLDGKSFIVPRSFGYRIAGFSSVEPSFSQGAYTIIANVKESTKDNFVSKLIIDNSEQVIEMLGQKAKQQLK